jgi:hypothetical protein
MQTNMSLPTHVRKYLPLKNEVECSEDDSDTTLTSQGTPIGHHKKKRRTTTRSQLSTVLIWIRWSSVFILQIVIIVLLLRSNSTQIEKEDGWSTDQTETGGDINGLYIPTKHKYTLLVSKESDYVPDMNSNEDRMKIRKNWDMLMPRMYQCA